MQETQVVILIFGVTPPIPELDGRTQFHWLAQASKGHRTNAMQCKERMDFTTASGTTTLLSQTVAVLREHAFQSITCRRGTDHRLLHASQGQHHIVAIAIRLHQLATTTATGSLVPKFTRRQPTATTGTKLEERHKKAE